MTLLYCFPMCFYNPWRQTRASGFNRFPPADDGANSLCFRQSSETLLRLMPNPAETAPAAGFEPLIFWELHKQKVVLYGALFLIALIAFGIYQITTQHKLA